MSLESVKEAAYELSQFLKDDVLTSYGEFCTKLRERREGAILNVENFQRAIRSQGIEAADYILSYNDPFSSLLVELGNLGSVRKTALQKIDHVNTKYLEKLKSLQEGRETGHGFVTGAYIGAALTLFLLPVVAAGHATFGPILGQMHKEEREAADKMAEMARKARIVMDHLAEKEISLQDNFNSYSRFREFVRSRRLSFYNNNKQELAVEADGMRLKIVKLEVLIGQVQNLLTEIRNLITSTRGAATF